jgi:membrane-bound metal-dependent hydrolase YbcI (DUF457 family)
VPTPISHAAVGFAIGAWSPHEVPPSTRKLCIVAAACAALPDIDVIGFTAHRGITHSIAFAIVAAVLVSLAVFPETGTPRARVRLALILGIALLSHSMLDGLTTYSLGIEFLAPFSQQRYRFFWTPLGRPDGQLLNELLLEALVVFLPAVLLGWLGLRRRRRAAPA